jgi:hypothetical protein
MPKDVRSSLPHLLWLYELGIVLFWLHDRSPEQQRTEAFVADTIDSMVRLLALANLPGVRAVRTRMLRWVSGLIEPQPAVPDATASPTTSPPSPPPLPSAGSR